MLRLLFEKTGDAVFLSHLDVMRIFQRAFQRANIMIWHSQGFTPRAYVSIALPLSVGTASRCEILEFEIQEGEVDINRLVENLNRTMPVGIRVLKAYESQNKIKNLAFLQAKIGLEYDNSVPNGAQTAIAELFSRESVTVTKHGKRGDKEVDIKQFLSSMELCRRSDHELEMRVVVQAQNPGLNPQLLVTAVERYLPELKPDFASVCREEVYDESMRIFR